MMSRRSRDGVLVKLFRFFFLASSVVICVGLGLWSAGEPRFRSVATLQVVLGSSSFANEPYDETFSEWAEAEVRTVAAIVPNTSLMQRLVAKHDLTRHRAFRRGSSNPAAEEDVVSELMLGARGTVVEGTRLVEISLDHDQPEDLDELTGWLVEEFLVQSRDLVLTAHRRTQDLLRTEAERTKEQLMQAERALVEFRKSSELATTVEEREGHYVALSTEVKSRLDEVDRDLSVLGAEIRLLKAMGENPSPEQLQTIPSIIQSESVRRYSERLLDQEWLVDRLEFQYDDSDEQLRLERAVLARLKDQYHAQLASGSVLLMTRHNELTSVRKSLERQQETLVQESLALSETSLTYRALQRDIDSSRALFDGVSQRLREVDPLDVLQEYQLSVVEPADEVEDVSRSKVTYGLIGFSLGLLLGVVPWIVFDGITTIFRRHFLRTQAPKSAF